MQDGFLGAFVGVVLGWGCPTSTSPPPGNSEYLFAVENLVTKYHHALVGVSKCMSHLMKHDVTTNSSKSYAG